MNRFQTILILFSGIIFSVSSYVNASNYVLTEMDDDVQEEKTINLIFIGNSITAGATLNNPETQAPPAVCGTLVEHATGVTTNIFNGGHSGITTFGFLPGKKDFRRVVVAAKSFYEQNGGNIYFSIMLGTNDSACNTTEGAPVTPENYGRNLSLIIDSLIQAVPSCRILLNYPIWYSPNTHNRARYMQEGLDRLRTYYPIIRRITRKYPQVYAGSRNAWSHFQDNNSLYTSENGRFGVFFLHPNATGAKHLAHIWTKSLLKIIRKDGIKVQNPLPSLDNKK